MLVLHSPQILHQKVNHWKTSSQRITLVPTMGCLHRGHLQLIERAKREEGKVIVSIFVNPLQFGKNEDFDKYPRPFEDDVRQLEEVDVDCLFAPRTTDLYPEGFNTSVSVKGLTEHLEGRSRPGHFDGVATVCLKLFLITQADVAIFGEKDFQQLRVIEKLVEDMNLSVRIVPHATVRESDGLALSSRNRYLSATERELASRIPIALNKAQEMAFADGTLSAGKIIDTVSERLGSGFHVDYLSIASSEDMVPVLPDTPLFDIRTPRFLLAARVGSTRLIDNIALSRQEKA